MRLLQQRRILLKRAFFFSLRIQKLIWKWNWTRFPVYEWVRKESKNQHFKLKQASEWVRDRDLNIKIRVLHDFKILFRITTTIDFFCCCLNVIHKLSNYHNSVWSYDLVANKVGMDSSWADECIFFKNNSKCNLTLSLNDRKTEQKHRSDNKYRNENLQTSHIIITFKEIQQKKSQV